MRFLPRFAGEERRDDGNEKNLRELYPRFGIRPYHAGIPAQ